MSGKKPDKFGGTVMILAGALFIIVNTVLAVRIPMEAGFPTSFASDAFFHRLASATVLMFLLMVGTLRAYQGLPSAGQPADRICFGLAFVGCAMLFAHEWGQVFFLHPLAVAAPEGLQALEGPPGNFDLYDFEAALAVVGYLVGWLAFSILLLVRATYGRLAPGLVAGGFLSVSVLTALLPAPWGGVAGNLPIGAGYILLGWRLARAT